MSDPQQPHICGECGGECFDDHHITDCDHCDLIDVSILYCQGCGACRPDDGSMCPPQCPVQLFPTGDA